MSNVLSGMAILSFAMLALGFIIGNIATNPPLAVIGMWTAGLGLLIGLVDGIVALVVWLI